MMADVPGCSSTFVSGAPPERGISRLFPYSLMAATCFAALLSFGLGREGGVAGLLSDTDDFMRTVQALDWIDGQGWNDTVQRRLNPPAGVAMHWSRLADVPLAAVIALVEPWSGRPAAVHLAVLLVPPLLGGVFGGLFLWAAASLIQDRRAALPIGMVATLFFPLQQMLPGRVDHHGLQLVLTACAIGFLIRSLAPGRPRAAVGLGLACGVSLAVGLETLPFLGTATAILCLAWVLRGGPATTLTRFGSTLAATSLALLFLTLPRTAWTAAACDRLSLAHVALAGVVLAAGGAALALGRLRPAAGWPLRLAAVGGMGIVGLALVAAAFPQCAGSPYAALPDEIRFWLARVKEAQSLPDVFGREPGAAVSVIVLPLAALVAVGWHWARTSEKTDPRWPALALLVLSGVALMAWQVRGAPYAGLAASMALIPLAAAADARADRSERMLRRIGLRLCIPALCLLAVVVPLQLQRSPVGEAYPTDAECDVRSVVEALTDPAGLGAEARTLAAPIDSGPGILFLTRHSVLAAPYHRNIEGLTDNRRIFAGAGEQALATVRARGVGAILFCRKYTFVSAYGDRPAFLNDRLASDDPPWWLVPVVRKDGMGLYRVHPGVAEGALPRPGTSPWGSSSSATLDQE